MTKANKKLNNYLYIWGMKITKYLIMKPIADMGGGAYAFKMLARAFAELANGFRKKRGFKHARAFYASRVWEGYEKAVREMTAAPNKHAYETGGWLYLPVHEGREIFDMVGKPFDINRCAYTFGTSGAFAAVSFLTESDIVAEAAIDNSAVKFKIKQK